MPQNLRFYGIFSKQEDSMKVINRIKRSQDFKKTMHDSLRKRTDEYKVFLKKNELGHMRIGISTSKTLGNAVVRARIRRQVRAFFSIYNIYNNNYDIVIVVQRGFLKKTSTENRDELLSIINTLMTKEKII